jgi:hypothetical protein
MKRKMQRMKIKLFRHRSTAPEQTLPLPPDPDAEIMPSETVQDDHFIIHYKKTFIKQIDSLSTLEPEPEPEPAEERGN